MIRAAACPIWRRVVGEPHERLIAFARAALDGAAHPAVRAAAEACRGRSDWACAVEVARRVQALPYRPDPAGADWVRPPCRTLVEGGDCDCLSVLACALNECLNLRWRLAWLVNRREVLDHVLPQVWIDGAWHWQETTLPGARLGEHPYQAAMRLGGRARVTG